MANLTLNGKDNCISKTAGIKVPSDCIDNVNWHSTMAGGYLDPANSPIGKTVALMDEAKANGIEVFIIAAALQSNTPQTLKFDLMASSPLATHLYSAKNSSDMSAMVTTIMDQIFAGCEAVTDPTRSAAGAEVILHDANTGDI